jgi:CheY-like chemotaxis protein
MRVLVAEDDADFRATLVEFLEARHVEVLEASDGLETVRHITRCRLHGVELDAVVLDLLMPRMGGIAVLRRIRDNNASLPIIAITAALEPALHRQAHANGARAVLLKPVSLPQLWEIVLGDLTALQAYDAALAAAGIDRPARTPAAATRVLVVDDEAAMREMLVEFLESRGYQASSVGDGMAAIRALIAEPADIVLLDIAMPGLSGVDALPPIRAVAPETAVIMVTANIDREIARRTLAYGAFDYLMKPLNWKHLTQSLTMALEIQALDAECRDRETSAATRDNG